MNRTVEDWTLEELHKERAWITFPDYQREPRLWPPEMKIRLIDSILREIDIPKLYFYKIEDNKAEANQVENSQPAKKNSDEVTYEVVDGQQRLWAIWDFLDDKYEYNSRTFSNLDKLQREAIKSYELQVTVLEDVDEEYLRQMFLRLQLGLLLNTGEKLHALSGAMKELVFDNLASHDFIKNINIPKRRYAKETLCAQICVNSFTRAQTGGNFARTRYEDLQFFFQQYEHPVGREAKFLQEQAKSISAVLDQLWACFREETKKLRNRSYILSVYLLFEEISERGQKDSPDEREVFARFILTLWERLRQEVSKGFNRTNEELYKFETYLSSAPGERYQIERRHEKLREYYAYFNKTGKIVGDQ